MHASAAGIDGFALDISADSYTNTQLDNAYGAAKQHGSFSLFISCDYAAHAWSSDEVKNMLNKYSGCSAQFKRNGKPLAITIDGLGSDED